MNRADQFFFIPLKTGSRVKGQALDLVQEGAESEANQGLGLVFCEQIQFFCTIRGTMLMQRAWLRTTRPAAMLVCALAASMAVVALYVHHEDMEGVLLQKAKKQQLFIEHKALDKLGLNFWAGRRNVIKKANSPIKEDDVPPFGESITAPPPACDQSALMNCLGALQADKRAFPHKHIVVGGTRLFRNLSLSLPSPLPLHSSLACFYTSQPLSSFRPSSLLYRP